MMIAALWVIAACEVIRTIQNTIQLYSIRKSNAEVISRYEIINKHVNELDEYFTEFINEEVDARKEIFDSLMRYGRNDAENKKKG